jgi:glycosyltransferase involved in cell wall biosynthesis
MRWPPTRAAALRLLRGVWPKVIRHLPDAELVLAGWDAYSLAADATRARGVTLLSDLDDHCEFFDRIAVLAFPLDIGSGMKLKVLEAMAMGVGVVTTPAGTEGLTGAGDVVWHGSTDEELADAVIAALGDRRAREERAHRSRALLEEQCSADVVARSLLALYEDIGEGSR